MTLTHEERGPLPLSWLATGTKIAAGLAIDLSSRMARANPRLGKFELLATTPGIVLIDEVDLHLHPTWQQRIVPSLREAFPRVQFILTTHSPQVLSTVEAKAVRILEDDGVHRPPHAEGLRSDVVLREVLGTNPVPQVPVRHELEDYLVLVYRGEGATREARALRGEIEDKLGGLTNNDELARADAYMALADFEV